MTSQGLVLNIQRFSMDDGPGIRSTVFLKGCNLQCSWCHNPESIHGKRQIQFIPQKCAICCRCTEVCPTKAQYVKEGSRVFNRDLCQSCDRCVESCITGALTIAGKMKTVDEVMAEVVKDRLFYENSGGEPLLQVDFIKTLLMECKKKGIAHRSRYGRKSPLESLYRNTSQCRFIPL